MRWHRARLRAVAMAAAACIPIFTAGQAPEAEVESTEVGPGIYMLTGLGGNLGASVGADGVFLVDDQYAPMSDKIIAAVAKLSDRPLRFVLNTHWHDDHSGGNENLGKAGALLVAHDNVRVRMSAEQVLEALGRTVPPSPPGALPVVTFTDSVTFHLNAQTIHAFHVPPAHTDGDALVHFQEADVVHMGDIFFHRMYPFIDVASGGSVDGMIGAVERVLAMAGDDTAIIPGHGPLATKADLATYRDFLVTVRGRVAKLIADGEDLEAIIASAPTAEWEAAWGGGYFKAPAFIGFVYDSLRR